MNEVLPGIYRLKLPLPNPETFLGYVNVYLLRGDEGYTLIDTGWNTQEAYSSLKAQFAEIGADLKQLKKILITHIHPDHYGLAGPLQKASGAAVYVHYREKPMVHLRYVQMDPLLEQTLAWFLRNGVPPDTAATMQQASVEMAKRFVEPAKQEIDLKGEEIISTGCFDLTAIWTPGHSAGQVCFYEPRNRVLFTGDHILPHITSHVGFHPQSSENPMGDFLKSLKKLRPMDVRLVLPAHEEPFEGLESRIDALIVHHDERAAHIMAQIQGESRTAYEIANRVRWHTDSGGAGFEALDPFDKRLALTETMAHLEEMRREGSVTRSERHGIAYFQKK